MEILFTRSDKWFSKIICKVTKEPVSHCAILQDALVIHSNHKGVHIDLEYTFAKNNQIVHRIPIEADRAQFYKTLEKYYGAKYDTLAVLYLGLRIMLPFLPKANLWQSSGMFLCTEFVTAVIDNKVDSMITPYKLYLKLKGE